jgi:hypothetical protein
MLGNKLQKITKLDFGKLLDFILEASAVKVWDGKPTLKMSLLLPSAASRQKGWSWATKHRDDKALLRPDN